MYNKEGILVPVWAAFVVIGEVKNDKIIKEMDKSSVDTENSFING